MVWKIERSKRKADQVDAVPDREKKEVFKVQRRTNSNEKLGDNTNFKN